MPDRASLHEAALRHLARFATTEAGLVRVLDRRVQRWAREAGAEDPVPGLRDLVRGVAKALVEAGAVDDAAFAAARAVRLSRAGRSRRATAAHLAAKGVASEVLEHALPPAETEIPAALAYARRRRIGPFRPEPEEDARLRDLGALARAGFPREVAERALAIEPDEAVSLIAAMRRG